MENETAPGSGGQQTISLVTVAEQFTAGLQRHFDLLAFNLAAHDAVGEAQYTDHANASNVMMPAVRHHQNFEQLQAYARDLLSRQVVNDSLNLTVNALNNCHFFLSLVKETNGSGQVDTDAQKQAGASQQGFIRATLEEKFNRLEKDYEIMCELEDSILSLGRVMPILVRQQGIVHKGQLDESGRFVLELKTTRASDDPSPRNFQPELLVDVQKIYHEGDRVFLTNEELQQVLMTIASFADSLFRSVSEYVRSTVE